MARVDVTFDELRTPLPPPTKVVREVVVTLSRDEAFDLWSILARPGSDNRSPVERQLAADLAVDLRRATEVSQ